MVLSSVAILTQIGVSTVGARNAIINDLFPGGLEDLQYLSKTDIKDACAAYAKRTVGSFVVSQLHTKRIISLMLWVRDQERIGEIAEFANGTTAAQLNRTLLTASEREKRRKDQKRTGEGLIDSTFNNKLKSQSQWEKWNVEVEALLGVIIGVKGIPLSYVIRMNGPRLYDPDASFETNAITATEITGPEFAQDAQTVHQIILHNVHEDSDAYTYIKPVLRFQDGRRDMTALRDRYDNDASRQTRINNAKARLTQLRYKSERAFSFERFCANLQGAYDELEACHRPEDNGNIVDDLWPRLQCSEISNFVSALKVDYARNPRDYRDILNDIAAEVGTTKKVSFAANVSSVEVKDGPTTYTRQGRAPETGVHVQDGSIFIGSYDKTKWFDDSVKPYHDEIIKARNANKHSSRNQKRQASAIKRSKRKLKKLQAKIASAKSSLGEGKASDDDDEPEAEAKNAGDQFGGKRSKSVKFDS